MKIVGLALIGILSVTGCAGRAPYAATAAPAGSARVASAEGRGPVVPAEAIVVEGDVTVEVVDVGASAATLRAEIEAGGGRVVDERLDGGAAAGRGTMTVRLAPDQVQAIFTWLGGQGTILDKHVSATDVSRTLFDRDLAIANKRAALTRLEGILAQGGATMADVLAVENEMTRLRGELEALEGEQRYLRDRVGQATLAVTLIRRDGEVRLAATSAALYPGVRLAMLTLLDRGTRPRSRMGVGLIAFTMMRQFSFEVDVFESVRPAPGADASRAVIATVGGAGYSDFFGRGRRRFGNPYLGFRVGYAYLDRSLFAVEAEAGVELVKGRLGVIDLGVRATGLVGKHSDAALVTGLGAAIAF